MKRTALLTFELSETSDILSYADEALSILQDEGLPAITCVPWGQVSDQQPEDLLGQNSFPTAAAPAQPDVFTSVTPSDPWLS
jgi:hypothetical protein